MPEDIRTAVHEEPFEEREFISFMIQKTRRDASFSVFILCRFFDGTERISALSLGISEQSVFLHGSFRGRGNSDY